jgi:hypothetical protein
MTGKVVDLSLRRAYRKALDALRPLVGYYTRADQKPEEPDYDPPHEGPCLICEQLIAAEECRTCSLVWAGERKIALFYRVHRACQDDLSDEIAQQIDIAVLRVGDEIARELP